MPKITPIHGKYEKNYLLTQNFDGTSQNLSIKIKNLNTLQKEIYLKNPFSKISDLTIREKSYTDNNRIIRSAQNYNSGIPKGGNGRFMVIDNGITLEGELKKGKIVKLERFFKNTQKIGFKPHNLLSGEGFEQITSSNIKNILNKTGSGALKLQNLTKVFMKKALAYLTK